MATSINKTSNFFSDGTAEQFQHVMNLYPQVLKLKAQSKNKKPEELIKLDNWYQNELPKKIKARGKDAHLNHEELVQLMKWKQTRGKFYPQLNYLVKVNTPRAVMLETKKAFKKLPNLELALSALGNLKGVGTTLASALLAAATPETAPFMADECLMAIPDIEGIDYTTKEYLKFVNFINNTVERLNKESKNGPGTWSAHRVELALWTHYVASELKPELLDDIPNSNSNGTSTTHTNGDLAALNTNNTQIDTCSDESNLEPANNKTSSSCVVTSLGNGPSEVEDTSSLQSLPSEKSIDDTSIGHDDVTNDSIMTESDTNTNEHVPNNNGDQIEVDDADLEEDNTNNTTKHIHHPPQNTSSSSSASSCPTTTNNGVVSSIRLDAVDDNASAEPPLKKSKLSSTSSEDKKVDDEEEKKEEGKPASTPQQPLVNTEDDHQQQQQLKTDDSNPTSSSGDGGGAAPVAATTTKTSEGEPAAVDEKMKTSDATAPSEIETGKDKEENANESVQEGDTSGVKGVAKSEAGEVSADVTSPAVSVETPPVVSSEDKNKQKE